MRTGEKKKAAPGQRFGTSGRTDRQGKRRANGKWHAHGLHRVCVLPGRRVSGLSSLWTAGSSFALRVTVTPRGRLSSGRRAGTLAPVRLTSYGRGGPPRGDHPGTCPQGIPPPQPRDESSDARRGSPGDRTEGSGPRKPMSSKAIGATGKHMHEGSESPEAERIITPPSVQAHCSKRP